LVYFFVNGSGVLNHEAVELLCASVFLDFFPKSRPPSDVLSAFLLVLRLIGDFEWDKHPLIINFGGSVTADDRAVIGEAFAVSKLQANHEVMYIVPWFSQGPGHSPVQTNPCKLSRMELKILKQCASASEGNLRVCLSTGTVSNLATAMSGDHVRSHCNVLMTFSKDLNLKETSSGLCASFATQKTFANIRSQRTSVRKMIIRCAFLLING
jgi:Nrap protein PAP/OAS1-like domain 5